MLLASLATFAATLLLSGLFRWYARHNHLLLDIPTVRSAHREITPKGGGLAIFAALFATVSWYWGAGALLEGPWGPVLFIVVSLVIVGIADDLRGLGVRFRLTVYASGSLIVCCYLFPPGWLLPVAALYTLWSVNSFNFMDGIDGLAALQAIFVCLAAVLLTTMSSGAGGELTQITLLVACACAGFLVFNWPRASLFMGDAGSVPMGFLLAVLSLRYATEGLLNIYSWLILMGVFTVDSGLTLSWRLLNGQDVTKAHNCHAYQRLSRRWNSHGKVLGLVLLINVLWLLPLAGLASQKLNYAPVLLLVAYLPLMVAAWKMYKFP